jgi:hypothetical protein
MAETYTSTVAANGAAVDAALLSAISPVASSVSVVPSGALAATNVQAALEEQARTVASLNTYRATAFGAF